MCNDRNIKELLPDYLAHRLGRDEQDLVSRHLETCEDCRTELTLLAMLSEDAVPDPGADFWAQMPDRIYREVHHRTENKKRFALPDLLSGLFVYRWAGAAAAACAVALVVWLLLRPGPVDVARNAPPGKGTAYEEAAPAEPFNPAELSSAELDAALLWAKNEMAPITEEVTGERMDDVDRDISEDISGLNSRELDRVFEMLKKKEQELKDRMKKKTNDKNVG